MRRFLVPAAVLLPATLGLLAALAVRPGDALVAADAYALYLGAAALAFLSRATAGAHPRSGLGEKGRAAPEPENAGRLQELARLEREVSLSTQSAFDAYYRLRPVLREIAAHRLGRRGVSLDRSGAAEGLAGPALWPIVRPDVRRPSDHFAPGLAIDRLRAAVEALEKL